LTQEKRCSRCFVIKPKSEFNRDRHKVSGVRAECKVCTAAWGKAHPQRPRPLRGPPSLEARARASEYRRVNREKVNAAHRRWYTKNKAKKFAWVNARRARQAGATRVETVDRFVVYGRDGGKCHICLKRVARDKFHLDHLTPISLGGDHTYTNVRIAHGKCNLERGVDRLPAQLLLVA
jgi:5-methylcytosine-specific restriction endonuclease McrA